MLIQSIRFKRSMWTKAKATKWIKSRGYKIIPPSEKYNKQYKSYMAFRQIQPRLLKDMKTIKIDHLGMLFIIGVPK